MADTLGAGGTRIVKITQDYAGDANVPGILMPFESDWLDMAGGTAQLTIEKNGSPLITGPSSGAGIEVYPGTTPAEGDIKMASGLTNGDVLTVRYGLVRYAEIPGT